VVSAREGGRERSRRSGRGEQRIGVRLELLLGFSEQMLHLTLAKKAEKDIFSDFQMQSC
jgi:hypothetical protein